MTGHTAYLASDAQAGLTVLADRVTELEQQLADLRHVIDTHITEEHQ